MDHSKYKYQNYDARKRRKKTPEFIKHKNGIDIQGVHYTYAPLLIETGIFQIEDCTGLSDFELSDTTDDDEHEINFLNESITDTDTDDISDEIDMVEKRIKKDYECHPHSIAIKKEKEECFQNQQEESKGSINKRKKDCCEKNNECCRKKKKIKRIEKDNYESESSIQSISYETQEIIQMSQSSRSFRPMEFYDVKDAEESVQSQQLFGTFFCEICNLNMSSEKVYQDHMVGKRHRKTLKLKDVYQAVAEAVPPSAATEGHSKYPKPPQGVIRRKVKQRAKIQDVIKNEVKKPCPGLNLVTEIQGLKETQYYCSPCNSLCSSNSIISHLTGFKHQLNILKHFRPGDYERMSKEEKYIIQDRIVGILQAIQKREGLGRMTVEVEELASYGNVPFNIRSRPSTSHDVQERSIKLTGQSFTEYYNEATIPRRTTADFYCKYCDAHMNNEEMWQSHITGKRHIKNLKKLPGDRPSKCKTIRLPNERAKLLDRFIDECPNEPIVGLDYVKEIQIKESNSESYNCFLCCSCHTSMDIVEHIVSLKHRKKYLDFLDYPYMGYISGMSELSQTPIIRSICAEVEAKEGHGTPEVHINKSSFYV